MSCYLPADIGPAHLKALYLIRTYGAVHTLPVDQLTDIPPGQVLMVVTEQAWLDVVQVILTIEDLQSAKYEGGRTRTWLLLDVAVARKLVPDPYKADLDDRLAGDVR